MSLLQKLVDVVKECSSEAGLDMNAKKTKTMVISKYPELEKRIDIKIDGESLEQVDQFKYLGTQVTDDAKTEKELNCRIGAAKNKFSLLTSIFTSKQLSIPLKLRVLSCYVFSVFGYGSEAWTLDEKTTALINDCRVIICELIAHAVPVMHCAPQQQTQLTATTQKTRLAKFVLVTLVHSLCCDM